MKKISCLVICLLLLLPVVVKAEVCDTSKIKIKSIGLVDKADTVTEVDDPSFNKLEAKVNLDFKRQGDFIEYRITIVNDSNNDFELSKKDIKSDYIDYIYIYNDNSTVVKAKSEKTINLRIEYNRGASEEVINAGYVEKKKIDLNLSSDSNEIVNPKTNRSTVIGLILILLGLSTVVFVFTNKKKEAMYLLIMLTLILPISISALCACTVSTDSTIAISKVDTKEFCYKKYENNAYNKYYFEYEVDMTWNDYLSSKYNNADGIYEDVSLLYHFSQYDDFLSLNNSRYPAPNTLFDVAHDTCDGNCFDYEHEVSLNDEIKDRDLGCYGFITSQ